MLSINHEIIKEDLHEGGDEVFENLGDYTLKCGGGRFQTEHHDYCYEYSSLRDESHFLLIIWVHLNLIIATEPIKKAIAIVAGHRIKDAVGEGQWECICDRGGVQFPVIYTDSYLSILF